MKKKWSFEENKIQDFQIEQFQQIMQIQGLLNQPNIRTEIFPSVRQIFQKNNIVSIIGDGPNANIKSFYYLLLCYIRRQHCMKLLNDLKTAQIEQSEQDHNIVRDRKISFNDKGALFLRGPEYQNYCLHKFKIFSFSKDTDFEIIQNSPLKKDKALYFKQKPLSSPMIKKLLSQFLKEILPTKLQSNYKQTLKSIQYYLNKHPCATEILTCLMRHILLSKYQVQSARDYNEQINDYTVCTTLCDAFAIDGLLCKENAYEINTWCKVMYFNSKHSKIFIVNISNDQFQQIGLQNDQKKQEIKRSYFSFQKSNGNQFQSSFNCREQINRIVKHSQQTLKSSQKEQVHRSRKSNSSMMASDEESQIPGSSKCSTYRFNQVDSKTSQQQSSKNNEGKNGQNKKDHSQPLDDQKVTNIQQKYSPLKFRPRFESNNGDFTSQSFLNNLKRKDYLNQPQMTQNSISYHYNMNNVKQHEVFQLKPQLSSEFQQKKSNIVNNNINNNIYLNVNSNDKPYLIPLINISTSLDQTSAQSFPCLNIKLS